MKPVISVENLSKAYRLGQINGGTLSEDLNRWWARLRKRPDPYLKVGQEDHGSRYGEYVWALKDVSFTVGQGEVLGIIGRNGAGKSTLLKILSRVTAPTSGKVKVKGRVASLLEVGTGFHPELTGRENIYLNGAILGMVRHEIDRKFNEIVDFAEIEKFIDTPVKRYSSGMYVRLAFAVAAHLEPEILIVDEVLAVGDAVFQKKCLGKMSNIAGEGRTVLFVSHNTLAINSLCRETIVIEQGQITFRGISSRAIEIYQKDRRSTIIQTLKDRKDRQGDGRIRFTQVWVEDEFGQPVTMVQSGQEVRLVARYSASDGNEVGSLSVAFALYGTMGEQIADLWNHGAGFNWANVPMEGTIVCRIKSLPLNAGHYTFNICSYINTILADWIIDAGSLDVVSGDYFKSGRLPRADQGNFLIQQDWSI